MDWYRNFLFPLACRMDPETVHEQTLHLMGGSFLCAPIRGVLKSASRVPSPLLVSNVAGIRFENPVGLAAGFDKNASALPLFESLGFGSVEVGTVTPLPQPGNPRPRIVRLATDRALINRMGFPSDGAEAVAERLRRYREHSHGGAGLTSRPVIGVNVGKMKSTNVDAAAQDYVTCFRTLRSLGDYFVLNVSSPNTPELRRLQEPERLRALFAAIAAENSARVPLFVKIAPDLSADELEELLTVCLESKIAGVLATNTTLSREGLSAPTSEVGGMSGAPLFERSLAFVERVWSVTQGRLPIIGIGGISSAEQALRFIGAGASLIQVYTGLVYEGPMLVKRINQGIASAAARAGCRSVSELVGRGAEEIARLGGATPINSQPSRDSSVSTSKGAS